MKREWLAIHALVVFGVTLCSATPARAAGSCGGGSAGWSMTTTLGAGTYYGDDLAFVDASHGYAIEYDYPAFFTTSDAAQTFPWTTMPAIPGSNGSLPAIAFPDLLHGFMVGDDPAGGPSAVWSTGDGGVTWTKLTIPWMTTNYDLNSVAFTDVSHGAVVGWSAIAVTNDGGATWSANGIPQTNAQLYSVRFADANHGLVVGDISCGGGSCLGNIWTTADGGATWTRQRTGARYATYFGAASLMSNGQALGWATGWTYESDSQWHEVIQATNDGGATWTTQYLGPVGGVYSIAFADALHGWATSDEGILATTDGGATWTIQDTTFVTLRQASYSTIRAVDASHAFALGSGGQVMAYASTATDCTPPTTTVSAVLASGGAYTPGSWTNQSVNVTLSAADNVGGTGVKETDYSISGPGGVSSSVALGGNSPTSTTSVTLPVTAEGITTITYSSTDNYGNKETPVQLVVKIDKTPPTSSALATLDTGASYAFGSWTNHAVTVTLSAQDNTGGSGVARIDYSYGSTQGSFAASGGAITFSAEAISTLTFAATDVAGNSEVAHSVTVEIDKTPPVTTSTVTGTPGDNGWYKAGLPVTLALGATDNLSGVARTEYWLNGAGPTLYTGAAIVFGDGRFTVTFRSVDVAGNVEATKSLQLNVDQTAPTVTCSLSPSVLWPANHLLVPVAASVTVSDAMSGPDGFLLGSLTSNETLKTGDVTGFIAGTSSTSGALMATRAGWDLAGRSYTLTYVGRDMAGNTAGCSAVATVPHNQ